jgi:catechol O-methyltransferase
VGCDVRCRLSVSGFAADEISSAYPVGMGTRKTLGTKIPFSRWSVISAALNFRHFLRTGQVGDGREAATAEFVVTRAPQGDVDAAIGAIDEFAYTKSFLFNVGDEKGEILDAAVRRTKPTVVLELGTYCGYSALRIARAAPNAKIISIEMSAENASVARRIWAHAGVSERITCLVGTLDAEDVINTLTGDLGLAEGSVNFVFLDHDKDSYLADLEQILERGWLDPGAVVVADNVKIPGVADYRAYMKKHEGKRWRTVEHETRAEYQTFLKDLVLESELLPA